jgi:hypothetical protein
VYLPTVAEYIVTNDLTQSSTDDVEFEIQTRWYFEDINREIKQLTGLGHVERVVCE